MSSPRSGLLLALMFSGIAVACADTTSPVVPTAGPLPSLTWQGADGPRTATLLGTELVLENGARIAIDTASAKNFRRLAISIPKMEALAQRMAPVWAKMGLPTPTSGPQARVALAALQSRAATIAKLDGVLALASPIDAPTLVAECDATMQFCGFDPGNDPGGGAGGSGGGFGGGPGGAGPCERLGLMLYQTIAVWRGALSYYDIAVRSATACIQYYGVSWPTSCASEATRVALALAELNFTTAQMESVGQTMRALGCI